MLAQLLEVGVANVMGFQRDPARKIKGRALRRREFRPVSVQGGYLLFL
jgi:hypothetical protein